MSARTLIYNADGTPAIVEMGPQERINALLVEVFGHCIKYQGKQPGPLDANQIANVIVDIVGTEPIEQRYDLKLEVTKRPHAAGRES